MEARRQTGDLVTGKTFTTSSQSQIVPYMQPPYTSHGSSMNRKGCSDRTVKVTKSKSASSAWNLDDPELKRRRRVASYKAYTVEGRVKSSLRKGARWFKNKYLEMRHGWW